MLGLFLAMVVLISTQVSARELAETSNTVDASKGHGCSKNNSSRTYLNQKIV
ncbi:hypothetical protein ACS0TY_036508 [Phlomoides rotata]